MRKILVIIIMMILSIGSAKAFDITYQYNLWGLGDLRMSSPGYIGSINLTEKSILFIQYEAFDCEQQNDFYLEVYKGLDQIYKLNCTGLHDNMYNLENGVIYVDPGSYDIFFDFSRNNFFQINDILIGAMKNKVEIVEINNTYMFRELNIFETKEDLRVFLILQNGFFGLIYFMLFALGIVGYRFR